ncbi:MAG: OadG family protein [Prevotella sp.]|nr:OadG family protein [Prevotella sp.]MCI7088297.1 OadG family protein [Prevotella sp.]MDD6864086.1 OadG family transporter subunit [Prevotella sp.]
MNKFGLLLGTLLLVGASMTHAQVEQSIKINEVMTSNTSNLQDEYGQREAWIEIANVSFTTYNVRGMFITTDRSVLDPQMSVPERMKRMSAIPSGEPRTALSGRQHLILFCNSLPSKGSMHLSVPIDPSKPTWVGLYSGNATQLIDSVTVPVIADNLSYARHKDGSVNWVVKSAEQVTPGISNMTDIVETKTAKLKREDPYGFGITVLAMGIVFFCLALLFVFFTLFGFFMKHRSAVANIQPVKAGVKTVEKTMEVASKTSTILQDGLKTKGIDKEVYMAVIAMALKEYQDNVHDVESGVITIKPKNTDWNMELPLMTQFHE